MKRIFTTGNREQLLTDHVMSDPPNGTVMLTQAVTKNRVYLKRSAYQDAFKIQILDLGDPEVANIVCHNSKLTELQRAALSKSATCIRKKSGATLIVEDSLDDVIKNFE